MFLIYLDSLFFLNTQISDQLLIYNFDIKATRWVFIYYKTTKFNSLSQFFVFVIIRCMGFTYKYIFFCTIILYRIKLKNLLIHFKVHSLYNKIGSHRERVSTVVWTVVR